MSSKCSSLDCVRGHHINEVQAHLGGDETCLAGRALAG